MGCTTSILLAAVMSAVVTALVVLILTNAEDD
jgi:hypothetical protein